MQQWWCRLSTIFRIQLVLSRFIASIWGRGGWITCLFMLWILLNKIELIIMIFFQLKELICPWRFYEGNYSLFPEYSALTWLMDTIINLISETHHLCESKKHHIIVFWKYWIITILWVELDQYSHHEIPTKK